ncbi:MULTISPECIES: MFS transporter [Pseudomonas syringae group]|uniref:MFS transporter n=1 Tax=Pseudomonas viridiflava TaxID=33069 RepID=A0ABU7N8C9_PSEVI|nr:MFS transporter [Pseudomonas viridiflava]KTC12670.1 MFS transporter [Pseudomonas marginalis ICMP 11289]MCF9020157.1 MFS transporter [Pseudomonas syringae]VVM80599.1 Inner membrane transport protein YdhP [Pseudomonas fluorescens]KIQ30244.1 MFS transporter [Pseudomonas viridiflava]MBI6574473.1 MFS transporter [Pseudomonas viridiflava]
MSSQETTSAAASERSTGAGLSIAILALAGFVIVTTEFLIIGLLPALARDLGISISNAGLLVTLFAFTVMLFGPPLTAMLSHLDRKRTFIVILLIFAASNALAAVSSNIWVLALARFIPALALPVFWGTASETAGLMAGPKQAGKAVAQVYLGISAAMLFGIPLGTVFADAVGWRGAFWALTALSVLMAVLLAFSMPKMAPTEKVGLAQQARILRDPHFIANLLLSILLFTAMFGAYTYLADTLERIAGIESAQVGWWLMGFGAVGLIGNALGGRFVDRSPLGATIAFALLLALGMTASVPAAGSLPLLAVVLAVWGIAHTALFPICQIRVMKAAPQAQALAGTLNVSAANAGIGLGSIIGGVTIEYLGLEAVGYVAAVVAVLAIALAWLTMARKARTSGSAVPA